MLTSDLPRSDTNRPYGGRLVNRFVDDPAVGASLARAAASAPSTALDERGLADLEMLAIGAFSPLEGFMDRADYGAVLEHGRLASDMPWTVPITLAVAEEVARRCRPGAPLALRDPAGALQGVLHVDDVFRVDPDHEAKLVYGTQDPRHPGVAYLMASPAWRVAGPVDVLRRIALPEFEAFRLDPRETRVLFRARGWNTVVAFQTRNPVHRAHEYIQKCALEVVDGLLLHPLVGATKDDDVPASVRLRCYRALLEQRFPRDRVVLSVFPAAMRYAGPREAVLHAIARKNYGCTHIVIGRDHAGVGGFYGPFAAHRIFDQYRPDELGITPLFFDATFYCRACEGMASVKTCPHGEPERLTLSGTAVRRLLEAGQPLPPEYSRPEVAAILGESYAASRPATTEPVA
jgi:sulfate adenylyltransferase